jgi:hypothetical protein
VSRAHEFTTSDGDAFGRPETRCTIARFDRAFAAFDRSPGATHALHASLPLLGRAADVIALSFRSHIA